MVAATWPPFNPIIATNVHAGKRYAELPKSKQKHNNFRIKSRGGKMFNQQKEGSHSSYTAPSTPPDYLGIVVFTFNNSGQL